MSRTLLILLIAAIVLIALSSFLPSAQVKLALTALLTFLCVFVIAIYFIGNRKSEE